MLLQECHLEGGVLEPVQRVARPVVAIGIADAEQHGRVAGVRRANSRHPLRRVPHVHPLPSRESRVEEGTRGGNAQKKSMYGTYYR